MPSGNRTICGLFACVLIFCATGIAGAQDAPWQVSKSSGEVWITTAGGQQVSLSTDTKLNPGDNVRTGKNGRVLLTRGEERIMVSSNTAIGIPAEKKGDLPTTIVQQAGTILLDVEKKNVRHFEIETPYLAAVVKGTQFRVTVEKGRSRVEVVRGQVQVADFKSGQNVLVLPGQSARNAMNATGGLQISGKGRFNAIEQGTPRQSTVRAIDVPAGGLKAPAARAGDNARQQTRQEMRQEMRQQMRQNGRASQDNRAGQDSRAGRDARTPQAASRAFASTTPGQGSGITRNNNGGLRIGSTLGEVKLDYNKVTNGLARGASDAHASARGSADRGGGQKSSLSTMAGLGTEGSLSGVATGKGNGGGSGTGSASTGGSSSAGGTGGGGGGSANSNAGGNGNGNAYGLVGGVANGVGGTVGGLLGGLGLGKKK
jgi:hypothetical protein